MLVLRVLAARADLLHDCTSDEDDAFVAASDVQQGDCGDSLTVILPAALTLNHTSNMERAPSLENYRSAPSSHHPENLHKT